MPLQSSSIPSQVASLAAGVPAVLVLTGKGGRSARVAATLGVRIFEDLRALGAALVALIWGVTFLISVPCHAALSAGFDAAAHDRLVSTNWIRTIAWTARAALSVWMLWQALELKKA